MMNNFMTLEGLCAYTGFSKSSIYKISQRNLIPKYRPTGRKLYFLHEDVDKFLLRNRIASVDELNEQIDLETLIACK
ncbi:excisionase family DNA binding protein [Mucilaginibacter sp. UYP25]|uniref:helix-turn-helix transcriptional regulator n=1 Tax=unclassified Mucilaginibacter TaxID=2617802 RepID=UPI003390A284